MAVFSIQGISLSAYDLTDYEGPNLPNLLVDAANDGANYVELSNISQIDLQTGAISDYVINQPDGSVYDETAKFSDIGPAIAAAEAQGLQVMLKPQVGAVDPAFGFGNLTDPNEVIADPAAFFAGYEAYILQWAELAQQYHVAILSIGNEMLAATKPQYTSYWDAIIAAVRQVYSGKLTYAALLPLQTSAAAYDEVQQIQFWNKLDFAGFDVYPSLTTSLDPSIAQLNAAWQENIIAGNVQSYVQSITELAESVGKPVLFTESGVASFPGANDRYDFNDSYIGLPTTATDYQNQANWWASFFDTWGANTPSWLSGLFVWDNTPGDTGSYYTTGYDIDGKPAELVVSSWYGGRDFLSWSEDSLVGSIFNDQIFLYGDAVAVAPGSPITQPQTFSTEVSVAIAGTIINGQAPTVHFYINGMDEGAETISPTPGTFVDSSGVTWSLPETFTFTLPGLVSINDLEVAIDSAVDVGGSENAQTYISSATIDGVALTEGTYYPLDGSSQQAALTSGGQYDGGHEVVDASPWNAELANRSIGTPTDPLVISGGGGTDSVHVLGTASDYTISGVGTSAVDLIETSGLGQNAVLHGITFIDFQDGTRLQIAPVPPPTLLVNSDGSATRGQVINLSTLVTISDPGNVGYQAVELWDSDGTSFGGQFVVNGVAQTGGHAINVAPANYANSFFDVGTLGGIDTLWAQLVEDNGTLTGWQEFTVTGPAATLPTLSVHTDGTATRGQTIALSTLVTIADPSNVGYKALELWDAGGTAFGGQFMVNGVAQTGGHAINVSPANVANTVFYVGTLGGAHTLWAQLLEDNGTVTGWQQFTVTAPAATLPSMSVHNDGNAMRGQTITLSTLVTITDPSNVGYQTLQLWDSDGTSFGGQFIVNGVAQTGGHAINVSPANFANTVFGVGILGGTDTLWGQLLEDNGTLTGWQEFTVTAPALTLPTLTVYNDGAATRGQTVALSSLVTVADPSNVNYQALQLWDSDGTTYGGQFVVNGAAQTGGHAINVAPANVANTVFDVGNLGGTDTLWAQLLEDNGTLTGWQEFTVTTPTAKLPSLAVHNDSGVTPSQTIALSTLVTISDPSNVSYQTLELWDNNGTLQTGQFVVNGMAQTGGHEIDVSPANVANTIFDVGTTGATDTLWARLLQDNGTLTGWQEFTVKDPETVGAGATFELSGAYAGTVNFAGSTGTLQLDDASGFTGTVAGMTGQDTIDLRDINFAGVATPTYAGNSSGGTLTITDGTHIANLALLSNYLASAFVTSSDGHGGTNIVDPVLSAVNQQTMTQPQHA